MTDTTERHIRIETTLDHHGRPQLPSTRVYIDDTDVSLDTVAVHFRVHADKPSEAAIEIRNAYGTVIGNGAEPEDQK